MITDQRLTIEEVPEFLNSSREPRVVSRNNHLIYLNAVISNISAHSVLRAPV